MNPLTVNEIRRLHAHLHHPHHPNPLVTLATTPPSTRPPAATTNDNDASSITKSAGVLGTGDTRTCLHIKDSSNL
jgi:hypothetical protein